MECNYIFDKQFSLIFSTKLHDFLEALLDTNSFIFKSNTRWYDVPHIVFILCHKSSFLPHTILDKAPFVHRIPRIEIFKHG